MRYTSLSGAVLVLLTLVFAFLAGSFAIRNGDFWLHLASGRLLARGEYVFGVDPFSYTTAGVYWANHSWLFDLVLYAGRQLVGEPGLAVARALVATSIAGLMLVIRQSGKPSWPSFLATLLAILALSPRLLLQPALLSCLLLVVGLLLLWWGGRALWALPGLCALWVNCDAWFVLGPLVVVLFSLGQMRQPGQRLPVWLVPACLLACLLSPHHVHALRLPSEWTLLASPLRHDPRFAGLLTSPWHLDALGPAGGYNLSAWAFFLLLGLGAVSFVFCPAARRDWRLPVWLAFTLLACWQVRLVSFFAVVAGPITALNLQDVLPASNRTPWPLTALTALAALLLSVLCWPGWLQGFQREDRRLAWQVVPEPALVRAAQTLAAWRAEGLLSSDDHVFTFHPDVSHYLAWFNPGERGFLDSRLELFHGVASDFHSLASELDPSWPGIAAEEVAARYNLACAVLYDPDVRRLAPALRQAVSPEAEWPLSHVAGKAVLLAHKDTLPLFDPQKLAFGAKQKTSPPEAPGSGAILVDLDRPWWERFVHPPGPPGWESAAAAVHLRAFEDSAPWQQQEQFRRVLSRHAADLVGLSARPAVDVTGTLVTRLCLGEVFLPDLFERPPELPLLAIRTVRQGLAGQPADSNGWLVLARAYVALAQSTPESDRDVTLPPLALLREIQIATALQQALVYRPDNSAAHESLALLFAGRGYHDLSLRHGTAHLRLARAAGPVPGEDSSAFANRLERLQERIDQTRKIVQDGQNRFTVHTQGLAGDPLARARVALRLGLASKALDEVLLRSHPDLYGVEGLRLLLELLLHTGRAQEARVLLDRTELRGNPDGLGTYELPSIGLAGSRWSYRFSAYDWFNLCQSAAAGNYSWATEVLERLRERTQQESVALGARLAPSLAVRIASEVGLEALSPGPALRFYTRLQREQLTGWVVQSQFLPVERADLHVVEGMLLLERGRPESAAEHFRRAEQLYRESADQVPALPGRPLALRYLERMGTPKPPLP